MAILFITSSRIGDAILSTGILDYLSETYPDQKITVACGPLVAGLFEHAPNVEAVIPLRKEKYAGHWRKLWAQVAGRRWTLVVDLRNSLVSRLIWADRRCIYGPHIDSKRHKAEQNAAVLGLEETPYPRLWFTRDVLEDAANLMEKPDGPVIAVGPAANWQGKTWPADRFIEIVKWLTAKGGAFEGAHVAVIAAPGEEAQAQPVLDSVAKDRAINLIAKGSPYQAAACISLCDFYIGNDSGLMHAAAACGIPTFGLFGPSWPHLYAPYGTRTGYARTEKDYDELTAYEGYMPETAPSLMTSLDVETVKQGITQLLNT